MKIYLAGAINGRSDEEVFGWRRGLTRAITAFGPKGAEVVDPARHDYRGVEGANVAALVESDKADIESVDVVVARCDSPSWGTAMEILYAYEAYKPVILYLDPQAGALSPWLAYHATEVATTRRGVVGALLRQSLRTQGA